MGEQIQKKQYYRLIAIICLVKLALHLVTNHTYGFHRDEFLYMDYGHHLAFGYFDIPPLTPFLAWISQTILDESVFALRFLPAVSGTITLLLALLIVLELGGKSFAIFITGLSIIGSALLRVDTMFMPVTFDVFFWTLCTYLLIKYLKTKDLKELLWLGLAFGLGVLNKYNIFLWAIGALIGLLLFNRELLSQRKFYIGLGIAMLIVLPNLIWQIAHNVPALAHLYKLNESQFVNVSRLELIESQLVFFGPGTLLWVLGLVFVFSKAGVRFKTIGIIYLVAIVVLLVVRGKGYYSLGIYPALIAIGAVRLETILKPGFALFFRPIYAFLILIFALLLIPGAVPILNISQVNQYCNWVNRTVGIELRRWEDGKIHPIPQDFSDMYGWVECGQKTAYWYYSIPEKERSDFIIIASNYGLAAAIDYFGENRNLPDVYNDSSGMIDWLPAKITAHKILYIGDNPKKDLQDFQCIKIVDSITNRYSRENGTYIVLASQCRVDLPVLWKQYYKRRKITGPFSH